MDYHYVYILRSVQDDFNYTGYTTNLEKRVQEHNNGKVKSTRHHKPFELVYFEGSKNQDDALHREKYLKSTYGKRYIKNRTKNDT